MIFLIPINNTMRQYKFRAWDKENKQWVYPYYPELAIENWQYLARWLPSHNDKIEVMQFTWLLDKNWKEIYFWDIVRNRRTMTYVIQWYDRANCIAFWSTDYDKTPASFPIYNDDMEYTEVIWNIYENPELLNSNQ